VSWRRLERLKLASAREPGRPLTVYCARSFRHRLVGLLGTKQPPEAHEALMLSPAGNVHTVGMRYSLTLVYLSADWQVLAIHPAIPPGRVIRAPRRARHCLEMSPTPIWYPAAGEHLQEAITQP